MKKLLTLFGLLLSLSVYAQEKVSLDFGKINQYEASMTEYEKDKDAEAVVLYELGTYYIRTDSYHGLVLAMENRVKIKILKQGGLDYANFEIPYYGEGDNFEVVEGIDAATYNFENGIPKKTDLDKKNIFEEKVNTRWRVKKIAMPDVRVGSVVEIKYTIVTPFFVNMKEWKFQKKIPVVYSLLTYRAIPFYEYTYILTGAKKFDIFSSKELLGDHFYANIKYKEMEYRFGMKDLPAFRDEEFIPSPRNYMVALNLQLSKIYYSNGSKKDFISTWPALCDNFLKYDEFGKYVKNAEKEAKKILPELNIASDTDEEKIEKIATYIKRNFNWNGYSEVLASQKLGDFLKKKTGNAADINLFLIGLLNASGIKADPVVLSTRDHGAISKSHPFVHFLNYVIAKAEINGKPFYIDATEPMLYYKELPTRCLNVEGLVVLKKTNPEQWVSILQENTALKSKEFTITVLPEESILKVNSKYTGMNHDAYLFRKMYSGKDDNIKNFLKEKEQLNNVSNLKIENSDPNTDDPFVFSFDFNYNIEVSGDKIFINPFCNRALGDNPFKQSGRTYPIDLVYVTSEKYKATIIIPEGYKVESVPDRLNYNGKQMTIKYEINKSENKIEVEAGYSFLQNIYEPKAYIPLKISTGEAVKRFSDMIVLAKI